MAIDSGSTGIRAILFNKQGELVAREYEKTPNIHPEEGATEYDPMVLWEALLKVVNNLFKGGKYKPQDIEAIGITNQRSSFCLWDRDTGEPCINFIGWQDLRSAETALSMNRNKKWRLLKKAAFFISRITGNRMMTATSMLEFTTDHTLCKLKWLFDKNPEIKAKCKKGDMLFGTLDTWFIYNLTGKKKHVTDYTNGSATTLLNPFELKWNTLFCSLFNIPVNILPEVKDTNGDFGCTSKELFGGIEIPIRSAVGDQQAALFGQCCFEKGDAKISQGTGSFVNINVGTKGVLSKRGLFPLIAWVLDGKPVYMLEGHVATAGSIIDWLGQGIGLSDNYNDLNKYASQCTDTEGVIFIPTPIGIRFPYFNPRAKSSILGLSLSTHKKHVARALFEGIALRVVDILKGIEEDTKIPIKSIKTDGGVSRSDILLQCLADFADLTVKRAPEPDMTATGAAYLAGLSTGFWKDKEELLSLQKGYTDFVPLMSEKKRKEKLYQWKTAIVRLLNGC